MPNESYARGQGQRSFEGRAIILPRPVVCREKSSEATVQLVCQGTQRNATPPCRFILTVFGFRFEETQLRPFHNRYFFTFGKLTVELQRR